MYRWVGRGQIPPWCPLIDKKIKGDDRECLEH
jgi:hypothetical protein